MGMTPTDRLRALLDERGVEYEDFDAVIYFEDARGYRAMAYDAPRRYGNGVLCVHHTATPEQAVKATLGPAVRHPKPHEQWTTVLLPEIAWDLDDRWPDYLSVAHDAHGEWRVYVPEATLGLTGKVSEKDSDGCGECRMDYLCDGYLYFRSYWCRECDKRFAYRLIGHKDALPKHCPNCGCKVVSE